MRPWAILITYYYTSVHILQSGKWLFLSSLFFTGQCSLQSSKPCSDTFNVNLVYLPTDKMPTTTPDMKAPDDAWFENKDFCKRHCEAKCIAVWKGKGCSAFSSMLKSNGQCSCYGWKSTPSFSEDSKYLFGYCVPRDKKGQWVIVGVWAGWCYPDDLLCLRVFTLRWCVA